MTSGYSTHEGLATYYEVHGGPLDRPPFLLLHGGLITAHLAFGERLLPALSALAPVVLVETQGHGHTGDRAGPSAIEPMADDVAAVLRHLKVERAHLVGHSLGALIGFGVALRHPELVASLTALGATYTFDDMLPELVKLQRGLIQEPSAELIPLLPTEEDFASWRAAFEAAAPDPADFDVVVEKLNVMLGQWPGWDREAVAAVAAPVLLVIGDNDYVRIDRAAEAAALLPDAQLAVLPGTTHLNITERADWLVPMIAARIGA